MNETSIFLTMDDEVEVYVRRWEKPDTEPSAILQIAHGMAEHVERYDAFAKFLNEQNIFVVGNDHRGHGKTGEKSGQLGYFARHHGFDRVVDDAYAVTEWIQKEYRDVPIFLMGHSMGSFLARRYMQKYATSVDGVILMGTAGSPGPAVKVGKLIAKLEMKKNGPTKPSERLDKMAFGSYNKNIPNPKTSFDWLSRDAKEVEKYVNDPLCGFVCSAGFFYDLFTGLEVIHHKALIQSIPKELPVFILSGDQDPVGDYSKGVQKVIDQYKNAGLQNITSKFYEGARHELLNETNRDEVYNDIYQWIRSVMDK